MRVLVVRKTRVGEVQVGRLDLRELGDDVAAVDHLAEALSERLLVDPELGPFRTRGGDRALELRAERANVDLAQISAAEPRGKSAHEASARGTVLIHAFRRVTFDPPSGLMIPCACMQTASVEPGGEGDDCVGDDELLRFVGGAVDEARAAAIRAHVDTCDDCRELLAIAGREARNGDITHDWVRGEDGDEDKSSGKAKKGKSARDRSEIAIGTEVDGRFRIEREIGRGGMGVVYAATHLSLRRPVAFKVLNEDTASDDECIARFIRETRVAAKLISPHAVRVIDVGRLRSGAPYMVMELLEGKDLERTLLLEGAFEVERALDYVGQVCDAVGEAHLAGIVHRDIKLQNLFLATSQTTPVVKVLDFGLAKGGTAVGVESSLTHAEALMGTPHYMPPEQLASSKDVDARADVWALGVALYRLLTRKYPFDGAHFAALAAKILGGPPEPPSKHRSTIPEGVERIVMRCLSRDPKDRYADANELANALRAATTTLDTITKPVKKPPPPTIANGDQTLTQPAYPAPAMRTDAPVPQATVIVATPGIPHRISTMPLPNRPGNTPTARVPRHDARPVLPFVGIGVVVLVALVGALVLRPRPSPAAIAPPEDTSPTVASNEAPMPSAIPSAAVTTADPPSGSASAPSTGASAPPSSIAAEAPSSKAGVHGGRRPSKPSSTSPRPAASGASPAGSAERHYEKM